GRRDAQAVPPLPRQPARPVHRRHDSAPARPPAAPAAARDADDASYVAQPPDGGNAAFHAHAGARAGPREAADGDEAAGGSAGAVLPGILLNRIPAPKRSGGTCRPPPTSSVLQMVDRPPPAVIRFAGRCSLSRSAGGGVEWCGTSPW